MQHVLPVILEDEGDPVQQLPFVVGLRRRLQQLHLQQQTLLQSPRSDPRRIEGSDDRERTMHLFVSGTGRPGDLLIGGAQQTVLVEVADDELAHRHQLVRDREEVELPQQVVEQSA